MIDTKPINDRIEKFEQEITRLKVIKNTAEMIVNRLEDKFGELETRLLIGEPDINICIGLNIKNIKFSIFIDSGNKIDVSKSYEFPKKFTDFNKVVNYIIEEVGG